MKTPEHLQYTAEHLWVEAAEDGQWLAGITDYAQEMLGDVVYIQPPAVGSTLVKGKPCGLVESVKTGSDLHAPADGTVTEINSTLQDTPELLNDQPYSSWIFKFRPDDKLAQGKLLDAEAYRQLIGS